MILFTSSQKRLFVFLKRRRSESFTRISFFIFIWFSIILCIPNDLRADTSKIDCRRPFSELKQNPQENILFLCPDVKSIFDQNKNFKLGVGFAGEYMGNPGSAFGHVFLILIDEESFLLSQTISYLADVPPGTSALKYIVNGLSGGFDGSYKNVPFYRLEHVYSGIERRDISIYKFSEQAYSIAEVIFYLIEHQIRNTAYKFLSNNCATGIRNILNAVIIPNRDQSKSYWIDYPGALINDFSKALQIYRVHESVEKIMFTSSQSISQKRLSEFENNIAIFEETKDLVAEEKRFADAAYGYLSFRAKSVAENRHILEAIEGVDTQDAPKEATRFPNAEFSAFTIGAGVSDQTIYYRLGFRPTFRDKNAYSLMENRKSKLELFKFDVNIFNNHFKLNDFNLINVEENTDYSWPAFHKSWLVKLAYSSTFNVADELYKNVNLSYLVGLSHLERTFGISAKVGPKLSYFSELNTSLVLYNANLQMFFEYYDWKAIFEADYSSNFSGVVADLSLSLRVSHVAKWGEVSMETKRREISGFEGRDTLVSYTKLF